MGGLKIFLPAAFLFLVLNMLFVVFQSILKQNGLSMQVLIWGNVFLFVLSIISIFLQQKGANASAPQLFIRYFYISFLVKFLLVAAVALLYVKTGNKVNKASVIACMLFYLIYTFIELSYLFKAGKRKNA